MTNKELQALRRIFFLSQKECAIHVAKLQGKQPERTWGNWERGTRGVPDDVAQFMLKLAVSRMDAIETIETALADNEEVNIPYYLSEVEYFADYRVSSVIDFRLSQSIAAYFFAEGLTELK